MTVVIIICAILALLVFAVILTPIGRAIRTSPSRIRPSKPYRRPRRRS